MGAYDVLEKLGDGGMSTVFRAIQQPLGREVALKVLAPQSQLPDHNERFLHEAQTISRLDHPNILPLFDFGTFEDITYLAMPLITGGTIRDRLVSGPMPPGAAWKVIREVGSALGHAHSEGVVHRDVKPTNILVHRDGRNLLADFGLARDGSSSSPQTMYGLALGTPGYMSPEQANAGRVDHRADIFAFGAVVYEMLTGIRPFTGVTSLQVVMATVTESHVPPSQRNPQLPRELDEALDALLAKRPEDRPGSMREAVDLLAAVPFGSSTQLLAGGAAQVWALTPPAFGGAPSATPAATPIPTPTPTPIPAAAANATPPALGYAPLGTARPDTPGTVTSLLEHLGLPRLIGRRGYVRNSYFALLVHAARDLAGPRWPDVVHAAGMPEYLNRDPAFSEEHATPITQVNALVEAVEGMFTGPHAMLEWAAAVDAQWQPSPARRRLVGGRRGVGAVLGEFAEAMDEVRGERLHAVRQVDASQYWVIHYTNLFAARGPRPAGCCTFVAGLYEALLRRHGLLNSWRVTELECGAATGSGDCVFAIRSQEHTDFSPFGERRR